MWLFPVLSILTAVAIVAILVQMGLQADVRSQLVLSLLSWAVVIVVYFANRWFINRRPERRGCGRDGAPPHRVLVLANQTGRVARNCSTSCAASTPTGRPPTSWSCRPARSRPEPRTHGPLDLREATQRVAQQRLDNTLATLHSERPRGRRRDRRLPARCGRWPAPSTRSIPIRSSSRRCHLKTPSGIASTSWTAPAPSTTCRSPTLSPRRHAPEGSSPMTIIAGFSSSRQGAAPLNLAAQIARSTGDKVIAAAIVERAVAAQETTRSNGNTCATSRRRLRPRSSEWSSSSRLMWKSPSSFANRPLSQWV